MSLWQSLRARFGNAGALQLAAAIRLHESGDLAGAERRYRAILAKHARHPDATHLLGLVSHQRGDHVGAIAQISAAIAAQPGKAVYHYNLGNALAALGRLDAAIASFHATLRLDPERADARTNLALAFSQAGRHGQAVAEYRHLLASQPSAAARHALARALIRLADADPAAAASYDEAAALLQPDDADDAAATQLALAHCHRQRNRWTEAAGYYQAVIAQTPDDPAPHNELANCYNQLGRIPEAILQYRETYRLAPNFPEALASVLACLNYDPSCPPDQVAAEHRRWAERVAASFYPRHSRFDNQPDAERRLRIGYVSPDLRRHPVSAIFEPILAAHDRAQVDVTCYYSFAGEDVVTLRLKALSERWRPVAGVDDDALCAQIRADRIDILVDLAGHTMHNRLLAFARRPAPLQVSWLGYFNTTGLATMDYFISDPWSSPPGQDRYYVEQLLRLPHTRFCYQAPEYMPAVSALPAPSKGYVTFGCLNNLSKVNEKVLALWSEVLRAVPGARLMLQTAALDDLPNRSRFRELCAQLGIAPDRLEMRGFAPFEQVSASYAEIDIALDPFPFCGGMTSLEALWLGVPVITLPAETIASRQSASMLMNLGLPQLIAEDAAQYVGRAVELARDLPRLAELRAGLRARFVASPLMDYAGFARELEAAYRAIWRSWIASSQAPVSPQAASTRIAPDEHD